MSHRIFYSTLSVAYLRRPYEVGGKSALPGGMSDMPGGMSDMPCFLVLVLVCCILSIELRQTVLDVSWVFVLVSC